MDRNPSNLSAQTLTDQLKALSGALAHRRLELNWTQDQLAEQSGVSVATLRRLEAGESTQLANWLRVLTALGLVDRLAALAPDRDPFDDLRAQRGTPERQRASGARESAPKPFSWGDQTR